MRKLQDTKPIWHALIWIAIYIVAVNIGDALAEQLEFPGMTAVVLLALSIVLLLYLRAGRRFAFYGVRRVQPGSLPRVLFYIPLFAIAFVQYGKGFSPDLGVETVLFVIALVVAVGFIEELLFRGFLLQALRTRENLTRAIVISGLTFGIGHVVNLLRGYSLAEQAIQIVAAILVGIALAYCVVLTGSILPGVAVHALFNLSGTLTATSELGDAISVGVIAIIMVPYIVFLRRRLLAVGPAAQPGSAPVEARA